MEDIKIGLQEYVREKNDAALVAIIGSKGSIPRKPGAKIEINSGTYIVIVTSARRLQKKLPLASWGKSFKSGENLIYSSIVIY